MLWDSFGGCFVFFCGNNIELPPMLWDSFDGFKNMATYVCF
jgi:hypothetical protein